MCHLATVSLIFMTHDDMHHGDKEKSESHHMPRFLSDSAGKMG